MLEFTKFTVIHLIHISLIVRSSFYECNLNVLLSSHIFHLSSSRAVFIHFKIPQTMEENHESGRILSQKRRTSDTP